MPSLPHGAWSNLDDVPENQKHAAIRVGPYYYNAGLFHIQARAAYAKAIVFAAESRIAFRQHNLIWAAISAYYCLFHFALLLVFIFPEEIEPTVFVSLIKKREGGRRDPTEVIAHRYLPRFLDRCESKGLSPNVRQTFENAKQVREFVNYGPRAEWDDKKLIFRSMKHTTAELERVIDETVPVIIKAVDWAKRACNPDRPYMVYAQLGYQDFITKQDLFYVKWCTAEVLDEAGAIAQRLS